MRKPIVAGNWKMNMTVRDGADLAVGVRNGVGAADDVEVVLCPPFPLLPAVGKAIEGSPVSLGAQNAHEEPKGAYTGEVSIPMLADAGCRWVILGHSERRSHCNETDELVNRKAKAVLAAGLLPIVCVGELLEQREAGQTERVCRSQVEKSLAGLGEDLRRTVIAYEPVWAIGTGKTATADEAQQVHRLIREVVGEMTTPAVADALRIQYGGSVKPGNAAEIFAQPDVDGGLIGGAALDADSFLAIVAGARR